MEKASLVLIARTYTGYKLTIHTDKNEHTVLLNARHVRELISDGACVLAFDAASYHTAKSGDGAASIGVKDGREAEATNGTRSATSEARHEDNRD